MYKDIDFKFKKDPLNGCTLVNDIAAIQQSLYNIINTVKGERIGDPNFGSNIKDYLFEKINYITSHNIRNEIYNIAYYEPRIVINRVDVTPNYDMNQYDVVITYGLRDVQSSFQFGFNLRVQG